MKEDMRNDDNLTHSERSHYIEIRRRPEIVVTLRKYKYQTLMEWWEEKGFCMPPGRVDIEMWNAARTKV